VPNIFLYFFLNKEKGKKNSKGGGFWNVRTSSNSSHFRSSQNSHTEKTSTSNQYFLPHFKGTKNFSKALLRKNSKYSLKLYFTISEARNKVAFVFFFPWFVTHWASLCGWSACITTLLGRNEKFSINNGEGKGKGTVNPCTDTEALYRPYSQ